MRFDRLKISTRNAWPPWIVYAAFLFPASFSFGGAVVVDGSLSSAKTPTVLSGPNYAITPDLGKQVGNNLFHSFQSFNLTKGEVATFSGPTNVANVLTRVTGGQASTIDGTIRCTIPNANFYLMNPAGVLFGPNANLDVSGSFAVTTANYIKMADGSRFSAFINPSEDTILTTAPPTGFGFLAAAPSAIVIDGSSLAVGQDKSLSIVGGKALPNAAQIGASNGPVRIQADDIEIIGSVIHAGTLGNGERGNIDIHANHRMVLVQSKILSDDDGTDRGGYIGITVGQQNRSNVSAPDTLLFENSVLTGSGNILVRSNGKITVLKSDVRVDSLTSGGNIDFRSMGPIRIRGHSGVHTQVEERGNIDLNSASGVFISDSSVTAEAIHQGAEVRFESPLFVSNRSLVRGNAGFGHDVVTLITGEAFISADSAILTLGNIRILNALKPPPPMLASPIVLSDTCTAKSVGNASSFVATGRSGLPLSPSGWAPVLELSRDGPNDVDSSPATASGGDSK